eukprot:Rmarinus@m.25079
MNGRLGSMSNIEHGKKDFLENAGYEEEYQEWLEENKRQEVESAEVKRQMDAQSALLKAREETQHCLGSQALLSLFESASAVSRNVDAKKSMPTKLVSETHTPAHEAAELMNVDTERGERKLQLRRDSRRLARGSRALCSAGLSSQATLRSSSRAHCLPAPGVSAASLRGQDSAALPGTRGSGKPLHPEGRQAPRARAFGDNVFPSEGPFGDNSTGTAPGQSAASSAKDVAGPAEMVHQTGGTGTAAAEAPEAGEAGEVGEAGR